MGKINKYLTKKLKEDIKRVGSSNIITWLKDREIKIPSTANNLFEFLSELFLLHQTGETETDSVSHPSPAIRLCRSVPELALSE